MKKSYLDVFKYKITTLLVLCCFIASSQENSWFEHEIDSVFTVEMPTEHVFVLDTIMDGYKSYNIYTDVSETITFMVQKVKPIDEQELDDLPNNKRSLKKYYKEVFEGLTYEAETKDIYNFSEDTLQGLQSIKTSFYSEKQDITFNTKYLLVNSGLYTFSALHQGKQENLNDNLFFNSIKLNQSVENNQFTGKSSAFKIGKLVGKFSIFGVIAIIIILVNKRRKKK